MKGKIYCSTKLLIWFAALVFGLIPEKLFAQLPTCDPEVPYYNVNLVGQPAGVWISPPHSRDGFCCSASGSEECTSFEVTLDSTAVALSFNFVSGAVPTGALYYQIDCGPSVPVGAPICISGPGPHRITFCKPGNNQNTYSITSISQPSAPPNDTIRKGCNMNITAMGMVASTVTWNSIYPGAPGQYNSYLSCISGCDSPNFNPDDNAPEFIHYLVCGNPIADECGYNINYCDTVVIRTLDKLEGSVTPVPATICASGGSVLLTGTATGGDGNYVFHWKDNAGNIIGSSSTYSATSGGSYTLEILDGLIGPTCPAALVNVPVTTISTPVANAGPDQTHCGNTASVSLTGSVTNATGGTWTGGNGSFSPSRNSLNASYSPTASEIAAGSVTLILNTTGTSGCSDGTDTLTINFSAPLGITLNDATVLCYGQATSFSPTISGGILPYTYAWSNGAVTSSVNVVSGSYCVTVTDAQGCTISDCGQVINPPLLTLNITKTDVSVVAGTDGTATANTTGGTAPLSYLWSDGQTGATATDLSSGTYSVTVTDANGCTISGTITVSEPSCLGFSVDVTYTNPSCAEAVDGTATATVSGGVIPLIYSWSNGQISSTISNLAPGLYTVVVTDVNLCQSSASINIVDPPILTSIGTGTDVSIVGGSDGTASAVASGGTPGYTYSWSNGASTSTITNLTAGTYTYTIRDKNGCTVTGSVVVSQPDCSNRTVSIQPTNVSCHDGNDASAMASMNFGTAPYTYLWNNAQVTSVATGLSAGTYSVTVTDSLNCSATATVTITEPTPLTFSLTSENVSCSGGYDGSINLNIQGGTFPYYYSWSNGVTAEDPISLVAGSYQFTATDDNGCSVNGWVTITQPQPLTLTMSKTDATCNGALNGSIDVAVTGGTLPYTYVWVSGQTSEDISGIGAGSYAVTVTDSNGCQAVSVPGILIDEPEILLTTSVVVDCPLPGESFANVTVHADGGSSPYMVSYDGGVSYGLPGVYTSSLPIGSSYSIVLKDSNNCSSPASYNFTIPTGITASTTFNPCVAPGSGTSAVTVAVTGGEGPYQVSWDNGNTFEAAGVYTGSLGIGNSYSIIAIDSNGCKSLPVQVYIPDSLSVTATASSVAGWYNVSCHNSTDGSIGLQVQGGTSPYEYLWSGPNGFTSVSMNISSLGAGLYTVLVTDSNKCQKAVVINITEPPALNAMTTATQYNGGYQVSCHELSDGAITTAVSGGVSPYMYQWTGPGSFSSANANISGISAGTYYLTATDQNGCTITDSLVISEPGEMVASTTNSSYSGFGVSCYHGDDGSVTLTTSGGTQPYVYAWSGPNSYTSNAQDLSGVKAGTYELIITDQNNCKATLTVMLTEPDPIILKGTSTAAACGNAVGSIDMIASGGIFPYNYSWSHGSTSEDPGSLVEGMYTVVVSDQHGCEATLSIQVEKTDALAVSASTRNATCYEDADGFVDITVQSGEEPFVYQWSNGSSQEDINGLTASQYTVHIVDNVGCEFSSTYTITQPDKLELTVTPSLYETGYNISTHNGTDGYVNAEATGGNQPYQFMWSNGSTATRIDNLNAGTYSVTCNAGGCISTVSVELKEPSGLEMPSAFSPNGDGANETFFVKGLDAYPDNKLVVVNRWGNEVFTTNNYKNTWDGTNAEGKQLPDGTYFVILEIEGESLVLKGYVDMRR